MEPAPHLGTPGRALLTASALAFLSGCGGDAADAPDAPLPGTPTHVAGDPTVELGGVSGDGAHAFHQLRAPSRLSDGTLLVPDGATRELRVFDASGAHLRTYGGEGEGPGEFTFLSDAWGRGDTLEAWDLSLARITRFLPSGEVRSIPLRTGDGSGPPPGLSSFVGILPDGWLLNAVASIGSDGRDRMELHRFGMDGSLLIPRLAGIEGMERVRSERWSGPAPLSPSARFAVHETRARTEVYVAQTLEPRIQVLDPEGQGLRQLHWDPPAGPAGAEALEAVARALEVGAADAAVDRGRLVPDPGWVRSTEPPARVPVFADLLVDSEGFIWVKPFDPARHAAGVGGNVGHGRAGEGGTWMVLSSEGIPVGSVTLPERFEPSQVTRDEVVGIHRDPWGVEHVRVHALTRR